MDSEKTMTEIKIRPEMASPSVLLDELVAQHPGAKQWIDRNLRGAVEMLESRGESAEVDASIRWLNTENGKIDMGLAGKAVERLALLITSWFREGGAKNYVEMTIHDVEDPAISYSFVVQKTGDGAKSAHQLRKEAEAHAQTLEDRLREVTAIMEANSGTQHAGGSFVEADLAAAIHDLVRRRDDIIRAVSLADAGICEDVDRVFDILSHHGSRLGIASPDLISHEDAPTLTTFIQRSWEQGLRNVFGMFSVALDHRDHALKAMSDERDRYLRLIEVFDREIATRAATMDAMHLTIEDQQGLVATLLAETEASKLANHSDSERIVAAEAGLAKVRDRLTLLFESARHLADVHAAEAVLHADDRSKEGFGRQRFHAGAAGVAEVFIESAQDLIEDVSFPENFTTETDLSAIILTKSQDLALNSLNAVSGSCFVNFGRGCGVNRASALSLKRLGLADVIPEIKSGVAARITRRGREYLALATTKSNEVAQ
jgi:hypothetical protein